MHTLAEMNSWTTLEARAEVQANLPSGWQFTCNSDEGYWIPVLTEGETIHWTEPFVDQKVALLSAYAWLSLRKSPARHPAWVRRVQMPVRYVGSKDPIQDPEDLDPDEVQAVYTGVRPKP